MSDYKPAALPFVDSLAGSQSIESQRILLRISTDLFVSRERHSPQQLADFERTILRLLARSDPTTRLIVAKKLAGHPHAPASALAMIEDMGGDGALHVLEFAPLPRERLLAAALGNEQRACALAKRSDLDADLVSMLSARPEAAVTLALAANAAAPIDAQVLANLARRAERQKPLAEALLMRPIEDSARGALFLLASSQQRAAILAAAQRAELGRANLAINDADHADAIAQLEIHALDREPELFDDALALALGCGRDLARRISREPTGEPLALALAALGAAQDVAVRILVSGELHSGARYTSIGALIRLKEALNPAAARRVIAALNGGAKDRKAHYQPVLDPTASRTPSREAAAAAPGSNVSPETARRRRALAFAARNGAQRTG